MYLSIANTIDHNFVVFNDQYERIKFEKGLAPIILDQNKLALWVPHINDNWPGDYPLTDFNPEIINELIA